MMCRLMGAKHLYSRTLILEIKFLKLEWKEGVLTHARVLSPRSSIAGLMNSIRGLMCDE